MPRSVEDYTRVYTDGGTVAHLLDPLLSPNQPNSALCGRTPWMDLWHGTGSQVEHERALDLKICAPCQSIQRHRDGGDLFR
jgi:hypothetical protein